MEESPRLFVPIIFGIVDDTGISYDGVTNANPILLTGAAMPHSEIAVSLMDSGVVGSTFADVNGDWTFCYSVRSWSRTYGFSATAADLDGNVTKPSSSFRVTVDQKPPTVTIEPSWTWWLYLDDVRSIDVTFSEPVIGVTAGDFVLRYFDRIIDSAQLTLVQKGESQYTLELPWWTPLPGQYTLELSPANDISDVAGNSPLKKAKTSWIQMPTLVARWVPAVGQVLICAEQEQLKAAFELIAVGSASDFGLAAVLAVMMTAVVWPVTRAAIRLYSRNVETRSAQYH